jgi:hypothetical protein
LELFPRKMFNWIVYLYLRFSFVRKPRNNRPLTSVKAVNLKEHFLYFHKLSFFTFSFFGGGIFQEVLNANHVTAK